MGNESTPLSPSGSISLGPNDYVEKYDVGFKFPGLKEKDKKKLKFKIETGDKPIAPIAVMPSATRGYVIIDGWSRYQIAKELQVDCPANVYEGLSLEQVQELFLSENLSRRYMSRNDKKELGFSLRQYTSSSNADIARLLGVTPSTVSKWFSPKERPSAAEGMAKLKLEIDKIQKKIEPYYSENLCRQPLEKRKPALNIVPALLKSVYSLVDAVERLSEYTCEEVHKAEAGPALKASIEHQPEGTPDVSKSGIYADNMPVVASHEGGVFIHATADAGEAPAEEHFHEKPNAPDITNAINPEESPSMILGACMDNMPVEPLSEHAGAPRAVALKASHAGSEATVSPTSSPEPVGHESPRQNANSDRSKADFYVFERGPAGSIPSLDSS